MKRPGGVTAIAVLSFIWAALNLAGAVFSEGPSFGANEETSPSFVVTVIWIVLRVGASAWNVVNGVGLLRLKNWARLSTITLMICAAAAGFFSALRAVVTCAMASSTEGALNALLSREAGFAFVELLIVTVGFWSVDLLMGARVKAQFMSRTAPNAS